MRDAEKEKVTPGDVIYIEANSGAVKRVGRSDAFATEFDLEAEEYVPLPKGDVHKRKEVVQDVTLHDLDLANALTPLLAQREASAKRIEEASAAIAATGASLELSKDRVETPKEHMYVGGTQPVDLSHHVWHRCADASH